MPRRKRKSKVRADGEGSIYKRTIYRKDGSFYTRRESKVSITLKGQRKRPTVYGKSQAEVLEKLRILQAQQYSGDIYTEKLSLHDYFERWHAEKALQIKETTVKTYKAQYKRHIQPYLGDTILSDVTPLHIQNLITNIATNTGKRQANLIRIQLNSAFKQAIRWQILTKNPVDAVSPVKVQSKEVIIWTPSELAKMLSTAKTHPYYALFYLAISTGLRRGELLTLKWSDIKKDRLRVRISKTRKGIRILSLSKDTLEVLKSHQDKQLASHGQSHDDLIFVSQQNTAIDSRNLNRAWTDLQNKNRANWLDEITTQLQKDSLNEGQKNILKKQKLYLENGQLMPQIRLHDLRHLHASILIKANRTPLEVAERLGHTNPSFTLDTYVHLFREQREEEPISIMDFIPESEDDE